MGIDRAAEPITGDYANKWSLTSHLVPLKIVTSNTESSCMDTVSSTQERGFTIIETSVAAFLTVVFLAGFGQTMSMALASARDSRLQLSANAVALEQIEMARGLAWEQLRMSYVDPAAPLLTESKESVSAAEAGLSVDEVLSVGSLGTVYPVVAEQRDGVQFTIWRYVTAPDLDSRRFVVEVVWYVGQRLERHLASTILSEASA